MNSELYIIYRLIPMSHLNIQFTQVVIFRLLFEFLAPLFPLLILRLNALIEFIDFAV